MQEQPFPSILSRMAGWLRASSAIAPQEGKVSSVAAVHVSVTVDDVAVALPNADGFVGGPVSGAIVVLPQPPNERSMSVRQAPSVKAP